MPPSNTERTEFVFFFPGEKGSTALDPHGTGSPRCGRELGWPGFNSKVVFERASKTHQKPPPRPPPTTTTITTTTTTTITTTTTTTTTTTITTTTTTTTTTTEDTGLSLEACAKTNSGAQWAYENFHEPPGAAGAQSFSRRGARKISRH